MRDLANYGAAALVFAPFVGTEPPSWPLALLGFAIWIALVVTALVIERD